MVIEVILRALLLFRSLICSSSSSFSLLFFLQKRLQLGIGKKMTENNNNEDFTKTFEYANFLDFVSKYTPVDCVQVLTKRELEFYGITNVPHGQVIFISRCRSSDIPDSAVIRTKPIRDTSFYMDDLLDEAEQEGFTSAIFLFNVDLSLFNKYWRYGPTYEGFGYLDQLHLLEIGWRHEINAMYKHAALYINARPIPPELHGKEALVRIMKAIRNRLSPYRQAECLDLLLEYSLEDFYRPGAVLTNAFALDQDGDLSHSLLPMLPMSDKFALDCCAHPRPFFESDVKRPMYCAKCEKILCIRCQRQRCITRLLSFIRGTYYLRMYKTKCKPRKMTRKPFEAVGPCFPTSEFPTLEDCFLFAEPGF